MKNDQYFPHDATAGNNTKLMTLIEAEGAKGYGVYWYLLEFLRQQSEYKGELKMLDMLARRIKTTSTVMKRIITKYALFVVEGELFYSPGLTERMRPLERKRAAKSEQCRRAADAKWLKMNKRTDAGAMQEEKRYKEEESKETTTIVVDDNNSSSNAFKNWEAYLDEAIQDEAWINLLATNSGMGLYFVEHFGEIVEIFRSHIQLHGTGTDIQSVKDIKFYFANYLRPGSITLKHLIVKLAERVKAQQQQTSPYCHENINPETGTRTYLGVPIPPDAPPRPSNTSIWSHKLNRWS